jgi:predicted nucleic acid-binding protein
MDAFDADVLIFAADPKNTMGRRVAGLFPVDAVDDGEVVGVGSVILIPEVLSKPWRAQDFMALEALEAFLGRLELRPTTLGTANLAGVLGATHGLAAADAIHLATAVEVGADRFITNDRRHFPKTIAEIEITYPEDLEEIGDRRGA